MITAQQVHARYCSCGGYNALDVEKATALNKEWEDTMPKRKKKPAVVQTPTVAIIITPPPPNKLTKWEEVVKYLKSLV
jgi:ABC-type sulfate transport system substrate-binding protein